MKKTMLVSLVASFVGCKSYDAGKNALENNVPAVTEKVEQPQEAVSSIDVRRQFTPLVCEGSFASSYNAFVYNLFDAFETRTRIYKGEDSHIIAQLNSANGYSVLLDTLVDRFDDVPESSRLSILCDAKSVGENIKGKDVNSVFEVDLVAGLYAKAVSYASSSYPNLADDYLQLVDSVAEKTGIDTKPYAEKVVEAAYAKAVSYASSSYPNLADDYLQLGDSVAEKTGIDTKPYAEKVVEASCTKAVSYASSSYPDLADSYIMLAAAVAKQDSSVVCLN